MRILQIMAGAEKGGAEKFFDRLIPALSQQGIEQHIVCRSFRGRLDHLKAHNIPVTTATFHRLLNFHTRRIIRQMITHFQPDIVLTWMSRASHLCPQGDFISVARLGGYYDLKYYKKSDYLIGNTPDIQQYFIQEKWPADKTAYLPNFVDEPVSSRPQSRAVYSTPEEAYLLLAMGRFHDDKAFDILIPALIPLPNVYLWLAGEGERKKYLLALAQRYGVKDRIRFIPWQNDVSALYQAADAYVCPSRVEPLGNVIIEAWAHHLPVIAAKSAGPKSLIQEGENGLLVPIDDVQALTQAIQKLWDEPELAQRLAQGGEKMYLDHFTTEKVCAQYIHFFEKILQDTKKG